MLHEINYSQNQEYFLNQLRQLGAVLETVILKSDIKNDDSEYFSNIAAIKGMEIIAAKYAAWFNSINPELSIENYFTIKIFPNEELIGEIVKFNEFLGDGYSVENNTLNLFTYNHQKKTRYSIVKNGFTKALLNPPYGLAITKIGEFASTEYADNETKLLKQIIDNYLEIILNIKHLSDTESLTIIRWSDNWSSYFESGKEWWGTYCWTIYDNRNNTITFIAASSTD